MTKCKHTDIMLWQVCLNCSSPPDQTHCMDCHEWSTDKCIVEGCNCHDFISAEE